MVRTDRYKLIVGSGRRERQDHLEQVAPLPGPFPAALTTCNKIPTRRST